MINTVTIKPALKALMATLAGLPQLGDVGRYEPAAIWENEKRIFAPSAMLVLSFLNDTEIGTPEIAYSEIAPAEGWVYGDEWGGDVPMLLETASQLDTITLRVKVESYDHTEGKEAEFYASRIRAKMYFTTTTEALAAIGVSYLSSSGSLTPSQTYDDRMQSVCVFDLRLSVVNVESDSGTPHHRIGRLDLNTRAMR